MIECMASYQQFHTKVIDNISNETYMQKPGDPLKDMRWRGTLLFSYECLIHIDSQLQLIVRSQDPSHFQKGDTRFEIDCRRFDNSNFRTKYSTLKR